MSDDNNLEVQWPDLFKGIKGLQQGARNKISVKTENIPIIFVPGIMGTRLKNERGEKVWDPDAKGWMLWNYGLVTTGPADKKKMLVGTQFKETFLEPYEDDAEHNEDFELARYDHAATRGWGSLSWSSYGSILTALHERGKTPGGWGKAVGSAFHMPVYAFGYNWTASNSAAGRKLKAFIDKVIQENAPCEHVILVTHSMGGLVARSACMEHGANAKVLGVVHGVQPVTGAPAAYWRMKAGFERPQHMTKSLEGVKQFAGDYVGSWVLGTNGEEVTALLGNMPGGLQLLPSCDYKSNDGSPGWLQFRDEEDQLIEALPKGGDPYEEIYKNKDAYWRLVNPEHLSPGRKKDPRFSEQTVWSGFTRRISLAKAFHQKAGLSPNYTAKAFYGSGDGHPSSDRAVYKLSATGWVKKAGEYSLVALKVLRASRLGLVSAAFVLGFEAFKRTDTWKLRGGFETEITNGEAKLEVKLQPPSGAGDGTVPESSGKAMQVENKPFPGIAHEPAYQSQEVQRFTFSVIESFCKAKINKRIGK
jgi:pimeloyl-ACP methyl ester carboxylesterase